MLSAKQRSDLNVRGPANGYTPLHDSIWCGHPDCANALLDVGAPFNIPGINGRTQLDLARIELGPDSELVRRMESIREGSTLEHVPINRSLEGVRVGVLLETEFIADEIAYYQQEFARLGARVDLLAYLWGDAEREFVCDIDSPNRPVRDIRTVTVKTCVSKVRASDYDIVIMAANYCAVRLREIPPMHSLGAPNLVGTAPAVEFYAEAMKNKKILKGAMCHGLWIVTSHPELLKGRKVICHTVVLADIVNAGATFVPAAFHVVIDDDLVTARSFADVVVFPGDCRNLEDSLQTLLIMKNFVFRIARGLACGALSILLASALALAQEGVAPGVPVPAQRNVIAQLFNWRFNDITAALPKLKQFGYSHVHVSPPQGSNERIWQWWGRYQPIDFSVIKGPLGTETESKSMNDAAHALDVKIIVDVVFNHTIDITEAPSDDFVVLNGDTIVSDKFPQFRPEDFHRRCNINDSDINSVRQCWLSNVLADLKTESPHVRGIAHDYLSKLVSLGVDGFRFDAAKHIEPDFFKEVLKDFSAQFSFGEAIVGDTTQIPPVDSLDFYDFPLAATMHRAFGFGGDLRELLRAQDHQHALPGPKAGTFVGITISTAVKTAIAAWIPDPWIFSRLAGTARPIRATVTTYARLRLHPRARGWVSLCLRRHEYPAAGESGRPVRQSATGRVHPLP